jgi:hypothetical protein
MIKLSKSSVILLILGSLSAVSLIGCGDSGPSDADVKKSFATKPTGVPDGAVISQKMGDYNAKHPPGPIEPGK